MRPIWHRSDIDPKRNYVLLLIESYQGEREFELRELPLQNENTENGKCLFLTEVVPMNLLLSRDLIGISEKVKLVGGGAFSFDPHGRWFTEQEFDRFKEAFE